jgi:hypothetical protein
LESVGLEAAVTACEECLEIAAELKGYLAEARSLLYQDPEERLRVVEALRSGEADAQMVEEFFATAPRLRPGAYREVVQAYMRKFQHERRTGHSITLS